MKHVVIVGAGIGGLASALRLLKLGYQVTIYEKEQQVGGRVGQLKTEHPFVFDLTAAILLFKQPFIELFEALDLTFDHYFDCIRLKENYRLFKGDTIFHVPSEISQFVNEVEKCSPSKGLRVMRFLSFEYERFLRVNEFFLTNRFEKMSDCFDPRLIVQAITLKPFKHSDDYVSQFKLGTLLNEFYLFQNMYVGVDPYKTTNIYTTLPVATQQEGIYFLKGGMYSFVAVLKRLVMQFGGHIVTNCEVEEVLIENNEAIGVRTKETIHKSDVVLVNADYLYAMETLIPTKKSPKCKLSCSAYMLYLGVKQKLPQLNVHNILIGQYFERNLRAPFVGNIPQQPSLYIYCPTRIDESLAPKGCESLTITVRVPHLGLHSNYSESDKFKLRAYIVNELSKMLQLSDFEHSIIYESELTPTDLNVRFNAYDGNAFGVYHNLLQTNYLRPHHKSEIKALYFVGASTHPGTGISLVLQGAKHVVDCIKQD